MGRNCDGSEKWPISKLKKSLKSVPEAAVKSEATASVDQSSVLMRLSAKASKPTLMASWTSVLAWSCVMPPTCSRQMRSCNL